MKQIRAIGFDLFNTLITAGPQALHDAVFRLAGSLEENGIPLDYEAFRHAHREAALRFIKEAQRDGRETHNRFWISAALGMVGYDIKPGDPLIAKAVDSYFSAFLEHCRLIPGTRETLLSLKSEYRLGLLSNFTHAPAARKIIERLGLDPFFDVMLISGELGYRKPHPLVFRRLIEKLSVEKSRIIYVGDDPEPDITGALQAGLHPVWMTYVRDKNLPFVPGFLSPDNEGPDESIPRISDWDGLLSLLKMSKKP